MSKSTTFHTLSPLELLKLVPNSELKCFGQLLGCDPNSINSRDKIATVIKKQSCTRILNVLITLNGVWLAMMRDVIRFLEMCKVSMRTTGCVLALPINGQQSKQYLSPQIVDVIAQFDASAINPTTIDNWNDALSTLDDLTVWLQYTAQQGEPTRYRRINNRKMVRAAMGQPVRDLYDREIRIDSEAFEKLLSLWRTLDYIRSKLNSMADQSSQPEATKQLKTKLSRWFSSFDNHIRSMRHDYEVWDEISRTVKRTDAWSESWTTEELFDNDCWQGDTNWDRWARFIEDVLSMANLESSSGVADLLRLDLLKDRPRLFEVWCMCQILTWYRSWGCMIELDSVKLGDPPVWNLNYSRASVPIAHIRYGDVQWWLFYQLFRAGTDRSNMPDLALLDGRDPGSKVIWIADPKYSEAAAYDLKDYVEVAGRYQKAFQPHHVWICEFFSRPEWFSGIGYEQRDGFSIVTDVAPKREGTVLLRRWLKELHQFSSHNFILAIDCSASFEGKISSLVEELVLLSNCAVNVICFANTAKEIDGSTISLDVIQSNCRLLGGGTLLGPLISVLENLLIRDDSYTELVMVTDGAFSDSSNERESKLSTMFAKVEQVADKDSLARIISEHSKT